MTTNEAYKKLKKKHPDLNVKGCYVYDDVYYIFHALPKGVKNDYDDPFYAVHRSTGKVTYFCPTDDLTKWVDAMQRPVEWK